MNFSDSVSTAGKFSPGKIVHLFGLVFRTWQALGLRRRFYLYYPPASPNWVPVLRDIFFLLAVRPFCKGLILHFHAGGVSSYAEQHPVLRGLMMCAYGRMSLGIVQGESCPDDPGYFNAKLKAVVPHGIDVQTGSAVEGSVSAGPLRILYVGIHTEEKGLFTLLDTARDLKRRGGSFVIHTVGRWYTTEEEERFCCLRSEYGLENEVHCLGQKTGSDLMGSYAWAQVLFFPTHYPWETMGIVQLEAMAHGIPVVASDWQGPQDVISDGETGYLCAPDRPDVFAGRLQLLAEDSALSERMGVAGRDRYESFYTEACFINRLTEALQKLSE